MNRVLEAGSRWENVFATPSQSVVAACMVDTSVVPVPGVRRRDRPAVEAAAACRARGGLGARSAGAKGARVSSSGPDSGPGEGNAAPSIRKGTRRIFRGRRVSVSGETTSPWLSRHESLPDAQDLQMTTLGNETSTESNIFEFVMR